MAPRTNIKKTHVQKDIGLCAQIVITILDSTVNQNREKKGGGGGAFYHLYGHLISTQILTSQKIKEQDIQTSSDRNLQTIRTKVETPIHDNIKELVTHECKEHGVKS
jgi:hypothetical protein